METLRMIGRRALMFLLVCTAFFTTFYTFSGVSAAEIRQWMSEQIGVHNEERLFPVGDNQFKQTSIQQKSLPSLASKEKSKSLEVMESKPVSLEEAVDWSRYSAQTVVATGYTAGIESTGKDSSHPSYGITFSGVEVRRDLYSTIAADPDVYPIGTILFVPDYGYGVVADTGSAIKGNKIDLYFQTVSDVYEQWGKREVEVYLIKKGNGTLSDEELIALNEDEAVQVFRDQIAK